jgi:DNA-directed RNA polymerase subunit E'/Rpb7
MEKKNIVTELHLHPEAFHPDCFYDCLLEQLKTKEMTSDSETGYIDQIFRIIDVKNPLLLDDGSCRLSVEIECNIFKPAIGQKVEVQIKTISEHGVFAELGKNRFLIPANNLVMTNTCHDHKNAPYIRFADKGDQILKEGDRIEIVITNIRYDFKCYCCIGKLAY